jgi:hypothetical protein
MSESKVKTRVVYCRQGSKCWHEVYIKHPWDDDYKLDSTFKNLPEATEYAKKRYESGLPITRRIDVEFP